jgi:hypothetical protein
MAEGAPGAATADVVDLSSDTQTRPTPAMRAAIAAAEVGDEQQRLDCANASRRCSARRRR